MWQHRLPTRLHLLGQFVMKGWHPFRAERKLFVRMRSGYHVHGTGSGCDGKDLHTFFEGEDPSPIPKSLSVEVADEATLPGWEEEDSPVARRLGDEWFDSRCSLVLVVPSVVTNGLSRNFVIHQEHPEFAPLQASEPQPVMWDVRLLPSPRDEGMTERE